jgi:hypothetical protein
MKNSVNILLSLLLVTVGCDDFLDVQPKTLTTPEVALNTENDIVIALNGAYSFLNDDGYGMEYNVIADAATDNGKIPTDRESAGASLDRIPFAYNLDLSRQNTAGRLWREAYQAISAVNNILARLEEVEFDLVFEGRVKAECLTMRALLHFSLAQVFAQDYNFTSDQNHLAVPYQTNTEPGTTPARNTMAEVYTLALADINEALSLFESVSNALVSGGYRSGGDIYFLNYHAALGLRARMYFYSTDYPNALADANTILNGPFTLVDEYTVSQYDNDGEVGQFIDQWYRLAPVLESEAIFQLDIDSDDGNFANRSLIDIYTANNGNAAHAISQDLLNLYEESDVRLFWYLDEAATPALDLHVFKYPGGLGINADAHHFPVMRLTEFQLMAAECEARIGDEGRALTLVNAITARAGATPIASSGDQLIEDIITERRKELAYEGHRLYDLKRLQRGFTREDCASTTNVCSVNYPTDLYAWPIPGIELDANPAMVQNAGYN